MPGDTGDTGTLVDQYRAAREQLERAVSIRCRSSPIEGRCPSPIARRQLVFELLDYDVPYDDLVDEVATFKRVCRGLAWRVESIALRQYQHDSVASIIAAIDPIVVAPTGSGKTVIVADDHQASREQVVLFLAHRRELIHQMRRASSPNSESPPGSSWPASR